MNPTAIIITTVLVLGIVILPRRWAALGVISGVFYLTQGQLTIVGGVSFTAIRIIELAAIFRVIKRNETKGLHFNRVDKAFVVFNVVYLLAFISRCLFVPTEQAGLMYRIGYFCDGMICYLVFRGLLRNKEEFIQFMKDLVFFLFPFALFMVAEGITGRNYFSFMGGVPETPILREGYYRCQASFRHAITAGSVGATLVPFYIYLLLSKDNRIFGFIGIILCTAIAVASHSSGPLMGFTFGVIAWLFWPFRGQMRKVRWAVAGLLLCLHLAMKAPVWFLLDRISGVIGGDGWHRANLIDKFIANTNKWWLMGMPIELTENWAATKMPWGGVDVTNEYVSIGLNGGLISLVLFAYLLTQCYKAIGKGLKAARTKTNEYGPNALFLWSLGAILLSHTGNLIAVTYWDQFYVIWYMVLAGISGMAGMYSKTQANEVVGIVTEHQIVTKY